MSADWKFAHILILSVFLIAWFLPGCKKAAEETPDLIVLHSGRMRGNVYPLTLPHLSPLQYYPYLAGYVKQVRAKAAESGTPVLLVDLGDSLEGSFASYATGGANMVALFNELGYDAIFLGNLDNNLHPELLAQLQAKILNPFENLEGNPATDGTQFVATLQKADLPIYLLANFYGNVSPEEFPERFPTWFGDAQTQVYPVRDYPKMIAELGPRDPRGITLLSWMKFDPVGGPDQPFLSELSQLGINAILAQRVYGNGRREVWSDSGFYDWKPPVSANSLRNNGGFVLARLDLKRTETGWKVLRQELLPMTANTAPADPDIVARLQPFADIINAADESLFNATESVKESEILQTYVSALTEIDGTQAVIYSLDSIRAPWPSGELLASDVFNSLPWTNSLVQFTLSPDQLQSVRKNSSLRVWMADAATTEPVQVTTSLYFATLLAPQFGLSREEFIPTPYSSEYAYFINYLKGKLADDIPSPLPLGWSGDSFE